MKHLKLHKTLFYIFPLIMLIAATSVFGDDPEPKSQSVNRHSVTSNILNINEHNRLNAKISLDFMNRIAVVNDRIVNIFGDEGTFVVQTDEATGQVFIKPTVENLTQPLSITLITENGITQDLTLTPTKSKAATLILKPQKSGSAHHSSVEPFPGLSSRNPTLQDEWLQVMKQAVLGELAVFDSRITPTRKVNEFKMHYVKSYQKNDYLVQVWLIKNTSKNRVVLEEKIFFKKGDLALSLQKHLLPPNEKTYLYILGTV